MAVKYSIVNRSTNLPTAELVVIFWNGELELAQKEKNVIEKQLERLGAKGGSNEKNIILYPYNNHQRMLYFVGFGKKPNTDILRRGIASAVQFAKQMAIRNLSVVVPGAFDGGEEVGIACVEGVELGGYQFVKYQSDLAKLEKERSILAVEFCVNKDLSAAVSRGVKTGKVLSEATIITRNLVNEPAKHTKPIDLVEQAMGLSRSSDGRILIEVLDRKECEARGMGAFLAVAQGSTNDPFFIHLFYQPNSQKPISELPVIALVGKGITFDSGGLNIKTGDSMETMKIDMAGAANVLGVFSVLEKLHPEVIVHGYIAACENMPSGSAIKPGDIVTAQSGKTIEIRNTDAEGRVTLADAIVEALKVKPDAVIDLATLTGACVVALGEDVAGVFSNNRELVADVLKAADKEGEQMWELPLVEDYREYVKSGVADVRNIATKRWGGAITGALFIQEFVDGKPWVHIDIAGPSYTEAQTNPVNPVGASGFATRTILRYLQEKGKSSDNKTS